jgi:hypothetical protein
MISNQPYSLCHVSNNTTGLLPVGWFIQNPMILTKVARYKRTQSDFISCHLMWPSVGNLTPTFVQNLIFDSMNLLMQISFRVIVDQKRLCCNRLPVPELVTTHRPFWTRVGSCFQLSLCCINYYGPTPNGFIWLHVYFMFKMNECNVKDSFSLSCIDMVYDICCAKSSVWYISTFAIRMTTSNHWFWFTLDYIVATSLPRPHTNGSFCLPEMLKLREHQCSQDAWIFLRSKRTWVYLCHCGQWYSLTKT